MHFAEMDQVIMSWCGQTNTQATSWGRIRESTFLTMMNLPGVFISASIRLMRWDNGYVSGSFIRMNCNVNSIVGEQEVCSVQYARPLPYSSWANNNKRSRVWLKKEGTEAILVIGVGGQSRGIYPSLPMCLLSVCKTFSCSGLQTAGWIQPGNWVNHKSSRGEQRQ